MTVMLLQNNVCGLNNNNNNGGIKPPPRGPASIEDQFRQQCGTDKPPLHGSRPRLNVFSLQHNGAVKREGKAMNYYRLWIYTCNAVLLMSVLGFVIVASKVVVADPRRKLIPGLTLHHPSLLYAYLALLTQSGLLQLLGCLGALKLNEKLLNAYWLLLLILLLGDALIGVVWIFRFDKMYSDLEPILKQRLQVEYGVDPEFTRIWDNIQHDYQCCGVDGPEDFNNIDLALRNVSRSDDVNRTELTTNDYGLEGNSTDHTYTSWLMSSLVTMSINSEHMLRYVDNVPESCCRILAETVADEKQRDRKEVEEPENKPTTIKQRLLNKKNKNTESTIVKRSAARTRYDIRHVRCEKCKRHRERREEGRKYATGNYKIMDTCANANGYAVGTMYGKGEILHFTPGCDGKLKKWLRDSAHVLGVLGYCVIAFLKLCFLGILRYEIREMIQKIKMLQGELQPPILLLSAESPAENQEVHSPAAQNLCNHMDSSVVLTKIRSQERIRANSVGNAFLLLQPHESSQTTPVHQIKTIPNHLHHLADQGNESDTNSHCALLIEPLAPVKHTHNGNNNFESHELQDLFTRPSAQI